LGFKIRVGGNNLDQNHATVGGGGRNKKKGLDFRGGLGGRNWVTRGAGERCCWKRKGAGGWMQGSCILYWKKKEDQVASDG